MQMLQVMATWSYHMRSMQFHPTKHTAVGGWVRWE